MKKILNYSSLSTSVRPNNEISIVLTDSESIKDLNHKYLGHEGVTDVITFDYRCNSADTCSDKDDTIGEVIVCPAVAGESSNKYQNSVSEEIVLYIIHGILHLCGYDDHTSADRREMRRAETEILDNVRKSIDLRNILATY